MATNRQIIAVSRISEILRKYKGQKNVSMAKILRDAGYSESVARKPKIVTGTKGFQEEVSKIGDLIPDKKLVQAHKLLLNSRRMRHTFVNPDLTDTEIKRVVTMSNGRLIKLLRDVKVKKMVELWYTVPIGGNIKVALDLAYKLKGSYAPEKQKVDLGGQLEVIRVKDYGGTGPKPEN